MPARQVKSVSDNTGSAGEDDVRDTALRAEQEYVSRVYDRLDTERATAEATLRSGPGAGGGSGFQAAVEREVATEEAANRLARLSGVERALCFGRVDHRAEAGTPGDTFYIGRVGLRDEHRVPLLIDWRAEAARPFYTATPSSPGTLARRRHLHLRGREVVRLDDEVFDLEGLAEADRGTIVGEAALLATLRRGRTGRMGDVVATIQEEQDQVIRSGLQGVLVVQGGPGTGKTVAALHRAAYLLYTHRDALERRGVLVVGPNATFLRYIEQVLPGLGETDVALATVGELYPGVRTTAVETPETAVVKGDLRMASLVEAAVREHQRVPDGDLEVEYDDLTLRVTHEKCLEARDHARSVRAGHNVQRRVYVHALLDVLALDRAEQYDRLADEPLEQMARSGGLPGWLQELMDESVDEPLLDQGDLRLAKDELWENPFIRGAIDALWPELSPQSLLRGLFADAEGLRRLGAAFTPGELRRLHRPADSPWTTSDVPLLDEAAEWVGRHDPAERARRRKADAERREQERYAREVIESIGPGAAGGAGGPGSASPEEQIAELDLVDAAALAERYHDDGPPLTTAQRASADREWAYGHVIVDEAQELSEMAWRTVMRRVPTRSLTVVGDIAQTGSPAGARSWGQMLERYVQDRWREQRLLVNYRTPAAIMRVAADVLAAVAPDQVPPEPVRDDGPPPVSLRIPAADYGDRLPALVRSELELIGEGRLAVIASGAAHGAVLAALPGMAAGNAPEALDAPAVVLTTTESKGLEFDSVIVVDPVGITGGAPHGGRDLYVAITRATRRLTVVHDGGLPDMLAALR
ncbi:HelD family protein [Actinomadura xylanilytica]|uniref:HelD family protein n=1 Tax=Actinomadura xylanilytica TaxID=887459 RepID=UPI00255AB248|nr:ATP-binding domain-containing protein [Actinomadura xylanilytica]MDL4774781.1 ATP-binding domain-containing protein [Actinomadura xylanilytica]